MKRITCILCPRGCSVECSPGLEGDDYRIRGNSCPKGADYVLEEMLKPMRMLTTTVSTISTIHPRLPVRTSGKIPREMIFPAMKAIRKIMVEKPAVPGDVVVEDFLELGIDLISSGVWNGC